MRSLDNDSNIFLLLGDDMLVAANHLHDVNELKTKRRRKFDMKVLGC